MKVLVVASHQDHKSGYQTAVVEIPDGKTRDEVFIAWYNRKHGTAYTTSDLRSHDYFLYGYHEHEVERFFQ